MKCLFVHVQAYIVEAHAPEAYGSLIVFFKAYRQRDKHVAAITMSFVCFLEWLVQGSKVLGK